MMMSNNNETAGFKGDIRSIAYQTRANENSNDFEDVFISLLGRSIQVSNNDYLEYGACFLIEKSKYNDKIILNFFDENTQEIIGSDIIDLEIKGSAIVPTLAENIENPTNTPPLDKYFGLTTTDKIKAIVLEVKVAKEYDRISLRDSNEEEIFYIDFKDSNVFLAPDTTVIYIFITNENKISINLAKKAWIDDKKNPLRNLKEYYLRNDEYKALMSFINPVKNIGFNRVIDSASGTLVGNTRIDLINLPILKEKRQKSGKISNWNKFYSYNHGDEAIIQGDEVWVSLSNNNKGNYPLLSQNWEKKDNLFSYYIDSFTTEFRRDSRLSMNPGDIYPGTTVSYFKDSDEIKLNINTTPGVKFLSENINAYSESGEVTQLSAGVDYEYTSSQDYENLIVFKRSSLNNLRSYNKLVFDTDRQLLNLGFLFFEVIRDNQGNIIGERSITEVDVRNKLSIYYTNVLSTSGPILIILGAEKESANIFFNNEDFVNIKEDEYKIIVNPDRNITIPMTDMWTEGNLTITEHSVVFPNQQLIGFDNYQDAYISDKIEVIDNISSGEYILDYVIDNRGNKISAENKEIDGNLKRTVTLTVTPEPVNELNSIITYNIYLSEHIYNVEIEIEDLEIKNNIIFEKYQISTTNEASFRYYALDGNNTGFDFYINGTKLNLNSTGNNTIEGWCNYTYTSGDIKTLKLSAIRKDIKIKVKKS